MAKKLLYNRAVASKVLLTFGSTVHCFIKVLHCLVLINPTHAQQEAQHNGQQPIWHTHTNKASALAVDNTNAGGASAQPGA